MDGWVLQVSCSTPTSCPGREVFPCDARHNKNWPNSWASCLALCGQIAYPINGSANCCAALWLRRGTAEKSHEIAPWHLIELHLIPNLEDRGPRP